MTILTLNKKELEKNIGKIDQKVKDKIDMFGTPIDGETDSELMVEVFPNRPDMLSMQGFSRAFNAYCEKGKVKSYSAEKPESDYKVIIHKSVKQVRPFTSCAIVKGLKFDKNTINSVIEIQEKLHGSFGRNRKKIAIGIYPMEAIKLPIRFSARKPDEIVFQPLEFPREINARQILSQHPKGRDYAHLLKDCEVFPVFEDANNEVLSLPPIINSENTGKIGDKTTDVFIEVSGFNKPYLDKAINMIVCAMADMGGKIYQMEVKDEVDGDSVSPNLDRQKMKLNVEYINKNLGLELKKEEVVKLLEKMGHGVSDDVVNIPAYRTDILHEIDLVEEVAIAYGYDNFEPEIPDISTIGGEDKMSILKKKVAEVLVGLGLTEISTYHLSTKDKQFKNIGVRDFRDKMIEVMDSKTENNILRNSLFANSINILSENSDASYPQKIFELGKVFSNVDVGTSSKDDAGPSETKIGETERLCVSLCYEKANFTDLKQMLDYLMRMFEVSYEIEETEQDGFIDGRCGSIVVDGKSIGVIGEVSPFVLRNGKIKMPTASMELDVGKLS
jgi:phenylalanyl-tRNA synthetase beta chain